MAELDSLTEDCFAVLAEFMSNKLGLDPHAICIQRVHRLGKLQPPRRLGPIRSAVINKRSLIAAFHDNQGVELITYNVGKLNGVNRDCRCAESPYQVPREIVRIRSLSQGSVS